MTEYETLPAHHPLRNLSKAEFAALGDDEIVYRRTMKGREIKRVIKEASEAPDEAVFEVLFGAEGKPRLVTDDQRIVAEWLEESDMGMVSRH